MTPEPDIERERFLARFAAELIAHGYPDGLLLRRIALRWIRRKRRAYWRALVAELDALGYRDLGGEG